MTIGSLPPGASSNADGAYAQIRRWCTGLKSWCWVLQRRLFTAVHLADRYAKAETTFSA